MFQINNKKIQRNNQGEEEKGEKEPQNDNETTNES